MTPLGWNAKGDRVLLRNEEQKACARYVALQVREIGGKEPSSCYDLLGDPDRRVACDNLSDDFKRRPRHSKQEHVYARPVRNVAPESVRVRYTVRDRDNRRSAEIAVSLLGASGWTTVYRWETTEYEYATPRDGAETLFPLEVALWPAPAQPGTYAVVVRGFDGAPGNGHRDWSLAWVRSAAAPLAGGGASWVRAVPTPSSLSWEPARAGGLNTRGVKALAAGDTRAAVKYFEDALRSAPNHVLARYNLACAEARSGWPARALATFTELMTGIVSGRELVERKKRAEVDADLASLRGLPEFRKLVCDKACPPAWDQPRPASP